MSFPYFIAIWVINNSAASSITRSLIEVHHQTPGQHISTSYQLHNESLSEASLGEIYTEAFAGQSFREQCFDYHTEEGVISKRNGAKLNCQSQNMGHNLSSRWRWRWTACLVKAVQTHLFGVMGCLLVCVDLFYFFTLCLTGSILVPRAGSDLFHKETEWKWSVTLLCCFYSVQKCLISVLFWLVWQRGSNMSRGGLTWSYIVPDKMNNVLISLSFHIRWSMDRP